MNQRPIVRDSSECKIMNARSLLFSFYKFFKQDLVYIRNLGEKLRNLAVLLTIFAINTEVSQGQNHSLYSKFKKIQAFISIKTFKMACSKQVTQDIIMSLSESSLFHFNI